MTTSSMKIGMEIAGKTDTGRKRSKNEDNFLIDNELGLIIVADGMGGHPRGEVASQLATQACYDQVKRALQTGHVPIFKHVPTNETLDKRTSLLGDCVKFANQAVFEASQAGGNDKMGTTLVASLWLDGKLAVAHVGDSRLYMVRDGDLTQCTNDHSFVQEQVDKGLLKPEEAEKSDLRNMLTRSVGVSDDVDVELTEISLSENDYVLVCSDGLTKMLDDDQIVQSFKDNRSADDICAELVRRANDAGGYDNVTAVVAKVHGAPSTWSSLTDRMKSLIKR